jgi:hypothetical protein
MRLLFIKFGKASDGAGPVFIWRRVYVRAANKVRWTPMVWLNRRYPIKSFWRGTWPSTEYADRWAAQAVEAVRNAPREMKKGWPPVEEVESAAADLAEFNARMRKEWNQNH